MRLALPAAALLLASIVLPAMDCVPVPYATDQCVRLKLGAAADFCEAALLGTAGAAEEATLADAFAEANIISGSRGVSCVGTTVDAATMIADIRDLVGGVLAEATSGVTGPASCSDDVVAAVATYCHDFVEARGSHLARRVRERNRDRVEADLAAARERHEQAQADARATGCTTNDDAIVQGAADALATTIVDNAIISPDASSTWTSVVPGDFEYDGRVWTPACWDGQPYRFFYKKGTVNKLLVNYEGGGACWDVFTCGLSPTFKRSIDPTDHPGNFSVGFADEANPDNPFAGWHHVYVPYCTGDIHWGDSIVDHQQIDPGTGEVVNNVVVRHFGFQNTRAVEKWMREHFVDPEMVFVTGSSAGAYGAIGNSVWLMEDAYPSTEFAVMGDAGNGVVTRDFTANEISKWGIETLLPDFIPDLNVPVSQLDAADLYASIAETYPNNRFATFTYAFDGGQGGQTGFYNIMLNPGEIFTWQRWWEASCAWNEGMRALNADTAARAPNFRFYVGGGSTHTTFFRNRTYTQTTGNVPTVASWVQAMIDDSPAWTHVECDTCNLLEPGDPRPNPPQPPFTAAGTIECPVE